MNKTLTLIIVFIALIGGYFIFKGFPEKTIPLATNGTSTPVQTTQTIPGDWKIFTDKNNNLTFSYPETLNTTYIQTVDWPPRVEIATSTYSCTLAGAQTERAGETKEISVGGNSYCVTKIVEGAAGSMYTEYAYEAKVQNKVLYYTFTLRQPQCANYDEPKRSECQAEEDSFDINTLINKVIQSTKIE